MTGSEDLLDQDGLASLEEEAELEFVQEEKKSKSPWRQHMLYDLKEHMAKKKKLADQPKTLPSWMRDPGELPKRPPTRSGRPWEPER